MSFSDEVQGFAAKAGKSLDETMRTIALDLFQDIIKDTPAETGRARGNWQPTIGAPADGEVDRVGADSAIAEVNKTVAQFTAGKVIYLANNLPYIWKLEFGGYGTGPGATEKTTRDGYSVQAPYGMARKNVARIQQIVAKAARDNKV